jgi:type VI secretion system protein ImpE
MLEAFIDGKYYWVPFTRLARLDIEAPADLRDHVWMPAHFTWANGGEADGFIPTRYPGSAAADDEALAWSRRTEWRAPALSAPGAGEAGAGEEWYLGLGQRMFSTDADEVALMDLRRLDLAVPDPSPPPDLSPPGSDADPAPPA